MLQAHQTHLPTGIAKAYAIGFWILVGVIVCGIVFGIGVLQAYDKLPLDIIKRIIYGVNPPDSPVHYAWLPEYYYDMSNMSLLHSYGNIESVEDFEIWASNPNGILHKYKDRPTVLDVPADIRASVIEVSERPGYTLTKFSMHTFFDPEIIIFYELLPDIEDHETGYNAVLIIPGTGHQGALDVLGEDGQWSWAYYQDGVARDLAHEGYAVYVIELRGYGERAIDVGVACNSDPVDAACSSVAVESKLSALGISMSDIRTDEITQILSHIESKQYVQNVAVAGLSLGGGGLPQIRPS